jgi:hypothetical protein
MTLNLADIAGKRDFFSGIELGQEVFQKLQREVASHPGVSIFGISLKGIQATDASFPRESVISLIKLLCGEKGFFLQDFSSDALLDNWKYAAIAKNQPVIVRKDAQRYEVIGAQLNGLADLLDFVMKEEVVTTSKVAKKFDISAPNASAKMKRLLQMGLVLGTKESAETGGLEYVYKAIKWSA